jgi:PKD domain
VSEWSRRGDTLRRAHGGVEGSQQLPSRRACLLLVALLLLALAGAGAGPASAVIIHLATGPSPTGGKTLSYQPLRGQAPVQRFDALFTNLDYNGGPVMASNTNYAIYWRPATGPIYPADYQAGVNRYFEDLAHDSGARTNVDSVATQYNDASGAFASYESHFGGPLIDTNPYPKNGCTRAPICLTDAQLQKELTAFVKAKGLPMDLAHEYFLLTPPSVEDCFEPGAALFCSVGSNAPQYCAYHGNIPVGGKELVYSNDPYVTGNFGCDDGNHPNGSSADGVIEGGLSHEHNESITDPEPNNAWADFASGELTGFENGDKCRNFGAEEEFGTPLGEAPNKATYNQVVGGHLYWYQQEWSNQGHRCLQRLTFSGAEPVATFTSKPVGGSATSFDASASTAPGGVFRYSWQFNDGSGPVETTSPTVSHKLAGADPHLVALTVFAKDGTSIGTAKTIEGGNVVAAPTPVTGTASGVTQTTAILNATVNPGSRQVTECRFEYGPTETYGASAPCSSLPGSGSSPVAVSTTVTGLAANTIYHFRIVAANQLGTARGGDGILTTLVNPPAVVSGAATTITANRATLNATVNPNGAEVTECKLEYGPTETYGSSAPCSSPPGSGNVPVAVSATVTGLAANASYHFRIIAGNLGGTSKGADQPFATTAAKPPAVATEQVSGLTQGGVTLNATVNPNGEEVTECAFEYGPTESYGSSSPCSSLPGSGGSPVAVSATVTGLAANSVYHFRIAATTVVGTRTGSDQAFTTPAAPSGTGSGGSPVPVSSPSQETLAFTSTLTPVLSSSDFNAVGVALNAKSAAITFTESVSSPGTFSWLLTFQNGKFGVFAASSSKCGKGLASLGGRCRPSRIVFARGSRYFAAPGTVSFTVRPSAAASKALRSALKQRKGLPVAAALTFKSSLGGGPVTHKQSLTPKLKR